MKKSTCLLFTLIFLLLNVPAFSQDSSWTEQVVPFDNGTIADLQFVDNDWGWAVGQDFNNGNMVILHTQDQGENWTQQTVPPLNAFLGEVFMLNRVRGFTLGTQYDQAVGLYTMDGGINWKQQSFPENSLFIDALTFVDDSTGWAGGSGDNKAFIYKLENDSTWIESFSLKTEGFFSSIHFSDDQYGWAAGSDWTTTFGEPILAMTSDGGKNWEMVELPVDNGFLNDVTFVNQDTGWVVGSTDETFLILETMDRGQSWIRIDSVDQNLFTSKSSPGSRYLGFEKVNEFKLSLEAKFTFGFVSTVVKYREQTGMTILTLLVFTALFFKVKIGVFLASFILSFFIHPFAIIDDGPRDGTELQSTQVLKPGNLVCYAFGEEQGENWSARPVIFKKEIKHSFLNGISVEPQDIEIIEGESVQLFVQGTDQYGESMEVEDPRWKVDGGGYIVTDDSGTWFYAEQAGEYIITCKDYYTQLEAQTSVIIDDGTGFGELWPEGKDIQAFQITPNPVQFEALIQFELNAAQEVKMNVYNQEGEVVHIAENRMSAGCNQFIWECRELPAGLYYVQLWTQNMKILKAVSIVK